MKCIHKFEGEDYATFEGLKMHHHDQFGRDYTVYCITKEKTGEEQTVTKGRK